MLFTGYIKKASRKKSGLYLVLSEGISWKPKKGRQVTVGDREYLIKTAVLSKDNCLIALEGVEGETELFNLVGLEVFAPAEDFYRKSFSRESLLGITVETDSGKHLGLVTDFYKTRANDVLEIRGEKEYLVPFTRVFIKKIDTAGKKILVKDMDGLLD